MKKILLTLIVYLLSTPLSVASEANRFDKLCGGCHVSEGTPTLAPAMFSVINNVKKAYPEKERFVKHILGRIKEPEVTQTIMPDAVSRYGRMPFLHYADSDIREISEYLFDKYY